MNGKPFEVVPVLNSPLQADICQRLHFTALRAAAQGLRSDAIPGHISQAQLRQQAHWQGPTAYLAHPADVERIFCGVTLAVYQAIESLYCSRLERSIRMVWRILEAMARQEGIPTVEYEAVWAICLYLDERRAANSDVTIEQVGTTWQVALVAPDVRIQHGDAPARRPTIACVMDTRSPRVLAFRILDDDLEESISLALYDAIVSQRQPTREGVAGLTWRLPAHITTAEAEIDLPANCQISCTRLGMAVTPANGTLPLLDSLRGDWTRDLPDRPLQQDHFAALFDNYLDKMQGYGPRRIQERQGREFVALVGYNRDPAWQFPALRDFLPLRPGRIAQDGSVEYDGLHYEDALLTYWLDRPVMLRQSEMSEALAWIYLDGEMLGQAGARELRRQDGSYRPHRPRR
ncbi:MAG: hypothetical protein KKA73_22315 [Chloroflexi bacterium]|nr:hypothetical protein [Chloroflexota bacterium]MBU1750428.1 hypothetical protein [Chloroflexota bacterium]